MAFGTLSVMNAAPPPPPHAPPYATPPWAQRKNSSTAIVGRMHVDGPPSRLDDVVVTLAPATPAHSAGAVNSTADVLDLMQDDDDKRYTPVTVTESPAATIPAEPSAGMMVARSFRSFEDARAYVRTLGLKSKKEWNAWRKSGARPHDIPSDPYVTYASLGWTFLGDFLGCKMRKQVEKPKESKFRSFDNARVYVRTLGLKSKKKWEAWSSSGKRPCDIPSTPHTTYASSGWLSIGDFLGYADSKVTGAYKRNAAAAGLWALQNDADNDEKDEQDEDDDGARRRKQAKRPRGG